MSAAARSAKTALTALTALDFKRLARKGACLDRAERDTLDALLIIVDSKTWRWPTRPGGQGAPMALVAEYAGFSRRHVQRPMRRLEALGLVTVTRRGYSTNTFQLHPERLVELVEEASQVGVEVAQDLREEASASGDSVTAVRVLTREDISERRGPATSPSGRGSWVPAWVVSAGRRAGVPAKEWVQALRRLIRLVPGHAYSRLADPWAQARALRRAVQKSGLELAEILEQVEGEVAEVPARVLDRVRAIRAALRALAGSTARRRSSREAPAQDASPADSKADHGPAKGAQANGVGDGLAEVVRTWLERWLEDELVAGRDPVAWVDAMVPSAAADPVARALRGQGHPRRSLPRLHAGRIRVARVAQILQQLRPQLRAHAEDLVRARSVPEDALVWRLEGFGWTGAVPHDLGGLWSAARERIGDDGVGIWLEGTTLLAVGDQVHIGTPNEHFLEALQQRPLAAAGVLEALGEELRARARGPAG